VVGEVGGVGAVMEAVGVCEDRFEALADRASWVGETSGGGW